MTTPYFADPAAADRLQQIAHSWLGTPYVQSGAVKGSGASCHRLAAAVLEEAGVDMSDVPERGDLGRRWFATTMTDWLDSRPGRFASVAAGEELMPGDLLLFDLGIGHIALYVGGEGREILQVTLKAPTHLTTANDPRLQARLLAAWRPLKEVANG